MDRWIDRQVNINKTGSGRADVENWKKKKRDLDGIEMVRCILLAF